MDVLDRVGPGLLDVVRRDFMWLSWNTLLAWVPVVLALLVFRMRRGDRRVSRSPVWWAGVALFVLFLPNAPYVVTDLVHLRDDIRFVGDGPVVTTVLPVYGAFIVSGFLAYYLALAELGRYLDYVGLTRWRTPVTLGLHLLCAVGVFLGRWTRLNSWEPVVQPRGTFERMLLALTWSWAPVLIMAMLLATAVGHFVTRAVVEAAVAGVRSIVAGMKRAAVTTTPDDVPAR
ncbi:DUF1361 domain-containing protein [Nocardia iowensis]|uniref:DUF1361 domain-containing protein n=1 Tax=Nocardia iowensis TaxID=204891 RepID=A0ABX8RH91_NOCIO|nr:DUF1361 domain-containing protein [Nocardia iowensis]QXN88324.1 DUF1361 domain-containing protein [Nocardia iowensis]